MCKFVRYVQVCVYSFLYFVIFINISKKFTFSLEYSEVNLIVRWPSFINFMNSFTFSSPWFHLMKISFMYLRYGAGFRPFCSNLLGASVLINPWRDLHMRWQVYNVCIFDLIYFLALSHFPLHSLYTLWLPSTYLM